MVSRAGKLTRNSPSRTGANFSIVANRPQFFAGLLSHHVLGIPVRPVRVGPAPSSFPAAHVPSLHGSSPERDRSPTYTSYCQRHVREAVSSLVPGELIFGRHSRTDANRTHVTAVFSALGSKAHACRNSGTRSKGQFDVRPQPLASNGDNGASFFWWR
jgi:hypothetical protein